MINDFLNSIKGDLLSQITDQSEINKDQLSEVPDIVTDTFKDGMVDKLKSGGISDILSLFGDKGSTSPFAGSLVNGVITNLISKLGLSKGISATIANIAVPFVIDKFNDFASSKGKDNSEGITEMLGDLVTGSLKDDLLGGLGKKFGF
jgi:hypothetical protein